MTSNRLIILIIILSQAIVTFIFFILKDKNTNQEYERISDSGISASWNSSSADLEADDLETNPLLQKGSDHKLYTMEKVMYYEQSRKQDQQVILIIYYVFRKKI